MLLAFASAQRSAAPAAIRPMPRTMPAPVRAKIKPVTNMSDAPIAMIFPRGPCSFADIAFQFKAAAVPSAAAPATMRPMPSGMFAPEKARIAPITSSPVPRIASVKVSAFFIFVGMVSQSSLSAFARPSAPTAIIPSPRGTLMPVNVKTAPRASKAPER